MKKSILLLFAAFATLAASAQTKVEINGIWYNIITKGKVAEVTYKGSSYDEYSNEYSGSIAIPATVTHNGVAYSVTSIGDEAFFDCSSLTAITIPESVTSIGNYAFSRCRSLTSINIPEGVTSIGGRAFDGTAWYYNLPDGVVYIGKVLYEYKGTMPANSSIEVREGTVSISPYAFDGCSRLAAITIPEGVTSIGDGTFEGCSSLKSITIPEGVTSIGNYAFDYCSSLTDITLPEGVTSIGGRAFGGTAWYNNQPDGVVYIGKVLYEYKGTMPANTSIEVREGTVSISPHAFYNCSGLTSITIPEGVTSIGNYAFAYCSSLTKINIPEGVTSIGRYAFDECSSLKSITIPEGVTSISDWAFYNCSSLKTVINYSDLSLERGSSDNGYVAYYADRVINIDDVIDGYAFKTKNGVHYLTGYIGDDTALTLPTDFKGENYQIGERAFYNCSSLTAITIPESVTSIGNYAFYNCSSLKSITIPEGVTSIGEYAFYNCRSLKELTLGKELKKIASGAFAGYTALEKVTIYATRPPSIEGTGNAFFSDATYENATLYVPQGCIDKYQVMTGWSSFYTIEEMEGGSPNYLTLRQADNGEVGIVVEPGRTYKVRITAFEGWKIHSVTFNDTDVTTQLTAEGIYTTPALQADAVLNIAYEKIGTPTMVANARASRIKVQGHRGTLRVTGTTEGDDISVYTTDGAMVAHQQGEADENLFTVETNKVYIVKIADKVVKIGM